MISFKAAGLFVGIMLAFSYVGTEDYKAEQADVAEYCKQVDLKKWPDYLKIFNKKCLHKV